MWSSFIIHKRILKFFPVIIFLLLSGYLYSQEITGLTSLQFYEQYGDRLNEDSLLIIDGRTDSMFAGGHIGKSVNIDADADNLEKQLYQHLDQPTIVIYCTTTRRTTDIVNKLRGIYKGNIIWITDGIRGWKQNGLPVNNSRVSP